MKRREKMSNVNQIYSIINEAKNQSLGTKAVTVVDTSTGRTGRTVVG